MHEQLGPVIWREYPGYEVSSLGRVRRATPARGTQAGRVHQPSRTKDGYLQVLIRHRGRYLCRTVARLVAWAFVPCPRWSPALVVTYRDGDRSNCRADNLVWATRKRPGGF